jgi:hypothetical protein
MNRNIERKERLELALRPAEPPTLEEVLEQVSTHGVLRGPVDWVFPAWIIYVEYATQKIIKTIPLSEEEKRQLFHFRDTLKRLLREAWTQAKEKLTSIYKAIAEGTYKVERKRLYAPDGTWIYVGENLAPHITIHGISASARFPDILKLPQEKLELFQLGWRASDEGYHGGRPYIHTAQPWQLFAWTATRYGALRAYVTSVNLTREGASVSIRIIARSWRQKWNKAEAIDLVASHLRRGEWTPLLTAWLGDGKSKRNDILGGDYKLVIVAKEPWRLGNSISAKEALVARGKEAFVKLRKSADVYGVLLDLLRSHKWIDIKLASDDTLRAVYKPKTEKRSIDVLREAYGRNSSEVPTFLHTEADKPGAVAVAGVVMHLNLKGGKYGSLVARCFVRDVGKALAIAERLESAELRPNIVKSGPNYVVYIAMSDLLNLAVKYDAIRRAIALYLAEKAKNGTPRQRELTENEVTPSFSINHFAAFSTSS